MKIGSLDITNCKIGGTQVNEVRIGSTLVWQFNSYSYLVDSYPSLIAYSVYKLSSSATLCMRIRRSSDNTEQDIGFVNNYIDTSAISSFVGANSAYVVKWYSQIGVNHLVTLAQNEQPRIVNAGTIHTDPNNGKVSMFFNGTTNFLRLTTYMQTSQLFTEFVKLNRPNASTFSLSLGGNGSTPFLLFWYSDNVIYTGVGASSTSHDTGQTGTGQFLFTTLRNSSNNVKIWRNGTSLTTRTYSNTLLDFAFLGSRAGQYTSGYIQEHVYYNSNQETNRTLIETNINSRY